MKNNSQAMLARYERARKLMRGIFTNNELVQNSTVFPVWIGNTDCFWYERAVRCDRAPEKIGKEYRIVNASAAINDSAFDHAALAAALAETSKEEVDVDKLPITKIEMSLGLSGSVDNAETIVQFSAFSKRWMFETATGVCREIESQPDNEVISPNGDYAVFASDYNLWLRNLKTGDEKALTRDGEEFYVYGAVGSAWVGSAMPGSLQVLWSPDSRRIFTVQRDTRRVKALPVVHHVPKDGIRPTVDYARIAFPGDEHIEELRLLAIDVETGRHQPASYCQIPVTRNSWGFFDSKLGWWAMDSRRAYFVDVDRYYKYTRVLEFDTETGMVRLLFEETSDTQINLMLNGDTRPAYLLLPESNELLWFSERSGWAHVYLYDLKTGALKNPVTSGEWVVQEIVRFDAARREVYLQSSGRTKGRSPYYRDLIRVNIDTGELATLASSDHDYFASAPNDMQLAIAVGVGLTNGKATGVAPSGNFAVITRSRANEVPVSLLIDRDGSQIMELEIADTSGLPEGWSWPEPVELLAADGSTDIYGLVYRPSDFVPNNAYPVVSHVFNTPDFPWVPKGSFTNDISLGWPYLDAAAIAELGFIVVQIDGRGASYRSKSFLNESYGNVACDSMLEDQVAGIRQLAERYSWFDLSRVGCYAPTGGPGPVEGLLRHPDFFKVGVVPMVHDSRLMAASMWGDKYEGPTETQFDLSATCRKNHRYPEAYADKLQGKLLLMAGMLDACTPPATAFRLIEALQKANKDFDMIFLPNLAHDMPAYFIRRAWDYLVRHLLLVEPPREFEMTGVFGAPAPDAPGDAAPAS